MKFTIFTPVFNEKGNLKPLYEKIKEVMEKKMKTDSWEMVFVNDGSYDGSLEEMKSIKGKNITIIDLQKNYGQAVAMDAGFKHSKGEYIISLDADLQNDPEDIPKMFEKMQKENLDVIAGWRKKRKDPFWMLIVTNSAKLLRNILIKDGIHDSGCTLRIYRRQIVQELDLSGEMHRYIVAILRWKGAKVGEMVVKHHPRTRGISKYNWKKSIKGLVDLLYVWFWKKFSNRPLHLMGTIGFLTMGLGLITAFITVCEAICLEQDVSNSAWLVLTGFLIIIGFQFFFFGIMMDLMVKTYYNSSKYEKAYSIRNIIHV